MRVGSIAVTPRATNHKLSVPCPTHLSGVHSSLSGISWCTLQSVGAAYADMDAVNERSRTKRRRADKSAETVSARPSHD